MASINRDEFHHNFLKSVIVRLDFQGVLEAEMEKVLVHVKPYAREQGFSRYVEKNANQIDIAVTDKGIPESIETTNRIRRQKVYSFIDENRGFVLDVSNTFICLTINTTHYTPFDDYCGMVPFVAGVYKENIDFFTVTRFGIRKINECLLEDKRQIQQYFNPELFNYYSHLEGVNTVQSNHINVFTHGRHHVNLITNIAQGQYEGKTVYSVRLDIDAYMDKPDDVILLLDEHEKQVEINDLLFEIYTSSLTEKLIALLTSEDDFDSTIMMGVERND